jgi:hypothetical protein
MAEAGAASSLARALVRLAIARARVAGGKLPPPSPPPAHWGFTQKRCRAETAAGTFGEPERFTYIHS